MTAFLAHALLDVLQTPDATKKAEMTRKIFKDWRSGEIELVGLVNVLPDRPARPDKPALIDPRDMPKRSSTSGSRGKIALLHALAHIELNAVDLACDIVARFSPMSDENCKDGFSLPRAFFDDWIKVADDEAKHFLMIQKRLADFDAAYGDLPAHDGLWESAERTSGDFAARLAVVPMVLEARGLDVTPHMIALMEENNDQDTADLLKIIHDDEITHVRAGTVWFEAWCRHQGIDIESTWQALVREYFKGTLKRPFNHPSRAEAGMMQDWYEPLADDLKLARKRA